MDSDLAQLRAAREFLPPASGSGGAAFVTPPPQEPGRPPLAACAAYPALAFGASVQKALLQMNIQLSQAVSDVTGVTGQKIIRAILSGVRDPQVLAAEREPGCKKSEEEIAKALTGTLRQAQGRPGARSTCSF